MNKLTLIGCLFGVIAPIGLVIGVNYTQNGGDFESFMDQFEIENKIPPGKLLYFYAPS